MTSKTRFHLTIEIITAAAICAACQIAAADENYGIRPNCNSSGSCYIRPGTYGYNDTWWRQWPTQYRAEVSDPRAVEAGRLPTPPGAPEVKLPPGGNTLSTKPPLSGESSALPSLVPSGSGSTAPGRLPPGDHTQIAPGPDGGLSIPGITNPPSFLPGGEGGAGTSTPSSKTPLFVPPEPGTEPLAPKSGEKEPAKVPDLDKPSAKPPEGIPLKPDSPSSPGDFQPPKPSASSGALLRTRRAGTAAADPGAPGPEPSTNDARASGSQIEPGAGLEGNSGRERKLVETSFEQHDNGAKSDLHNALDGYCPVELREKEKWIAGRSELRVIYQGQVFRFASEAAKRRFASSPEKYAPANRGNDAVLGMEENRVVSGSIQHSAVWQGRLYLFASSANLAAFREDPTRYAKHALPSTESNAVAEQRTAADSTAKSVRQQAKEPQRLRLPSDSL